ncbi:hypothetical protein [Pseudorhodoplanes sinuspersici]|uniref:hypothetical protein n=1 Tax=Pseudorhodoplanes sinuspersici TaxID=1235591 RepID=UPI0011C3991F|nr:hypothetical protein [Pseudorhodoplanes sinuspersici]
METARKKWAGGTAPPAQCLHPSESLGVRISLIIDGKAGGEDARIQPADVGTDSNVSSSFGLFYVTPNLGRSRHGFFPGLAVNDADLPFPTEPFLSGVNPH